MEIQLFDTELNMAPVDVQKIPKSDTTDEKTEEKREVQVDDPSKEYTILTDILDKPKDKEKEIIEEEPKDTKKPASEQSADSSKFPYSTFAKALYEEGVVSLDETKFKDLVESTGSEAEALIETIRQEIEEKRDADFNRLSPAGKEFLQAIEKGVPLDTFINIKAQEYTYTSIKEESLADDEELCKRLIEDDLVFRGFDKDEIKDQLADAENLGKLEPKAKAALKKLKVAHAEAIKEQERVAEEHTKRSIEENKKQLASLKSEIEKVKEIIPGVTINAKLKGELYDAITTPAEQLPNGQWVNAVYAKRAKDPVSWDIKVAYLDKLGIFDGKWDKLLTGTKTAAVKDLTEKLSTGNISKTGDAAAPEVTPAAKDILKSMESFRQKKNY